MKQRPGLSNEQLRLLLRRGDPAAGQSPEAAELERIRRRILTEARPLTAQPKLRPAWALAGALALLFVMLAGPETRRPPAQSIPPETSQTPRQVQFVTANGTRIYWTLDPSFQI